MEIRGPSRRQERQRVESICADIVRRSGFTIRFGADELHERVVFHSTGIGRIFQSFA
jgi:hypothetical protein